MLFDKQHEITQIIIIGNDDVQDMIDGTIKEFKIDGNNFILKYQRFA